MGNGEETDGVQTGEGWVGVPGRCCMCLYMYVLYPFHVRTKTGSNPG